MIHDKDLRSSQDYNEGQKAAAHRVLVELAKGSAEKYTELKNRENGIFEKDYYQ